MSAVQWRFEALDTFFFRDGRPFNAGESVWIDSQFPPTGRILQGAIRTAVLTHLGVDFEAFAKGSEHSPCTHGGRDLTDALGNAISLGKLTLTGPFLTLDDERLFPAPLDLVGHDGGFVLLRPGDAVHCDLGPVSLPRASGHGLKTQEGKYVQRQAMEKLLAGNAEDIVSVWHDGPNVAGNLWPLFTETPDAPALADREPKIGLARDNDKRTSEQGMLYSIAPVRPRKGVSLVILVDGLDPSDCPSVPFCQRLGGERKLARVTVGRPPSWPAMPSLSQHDGRFRFKFVLTTPAYFNGGWLPTGFNQISLAGQTAWRGNLHGVTCDILSACVGKPQKIGGWDMANNQPRADETYVPAGSVFFCEADAGQTQDFSALHGNKIGANTEYGFGHLLVGNWGLQK